MTKRKILLLAMSLCVVAILAVGGTLAYFTDTESETNTFTYGNIDITLDENFDEENAELMPGSPNSVTKEVKVVNTGDNPAYLWIEVWIPAALDDGDDNSPLAPGLGNSLHFNYPKGVTETKNTFLGTKKIGDVEYNGYVHYIAGLKEADGIKKNGDSGLLLQKVYMDKLVTQCTDTTHDDECLVLMDGETHYTGSWEIIINAVGFQSEGVPTIEEAINIYYAENGRKVEDHIW